MDIPEDIKFSHMVQDSINKVIRPELLKLFDNDYQAFKETADYIFNKAQTVRAEHLEKKKPR